MRAHRCIMASHAIILVMLLVMLLVGMASAHSIGNHAHVQHDYSTMSKVLDAPLRTCARGLCVSFHFLRKFDLELEPLQLFDNNDGNALNTHATLLNVTWLRGHIVGEPLSDVRFTMRGNVYYGSIHTMRNGTFLVEETADGKMRILHETALVQVPHRVADPLIHVHHGPHKGNRTRRAGPASTAQTHCRIFLDADALFFQRWGGTGTQAEREARTIVKMVDTMFQVAGVYDLPGNFNGKLSLQIAGFMIHLGYAFIPDASSGVRLSTQVLQNYQAWVGQSAPRGPDNPASQDVCLNHLFTHVNLAGVLGVAIQASSNPSIVGGVCEQGLADGNVAVNTAFTNTMPADGGIVPAWQTVLSTSHEVGHNFGARHDCRLDANDPTEALAACTEVVGFDPCVPALGQGGAYLMYPAVGQDENHVNARYFSPCSLSQILDVIAAKGECLVERVPCTGTSECCAGYNYKAAGVVCRAPSADEPCLRTAVCTGSDATCPAPEHVDDGTPCTTSRVAGVCSNGVCRGLNDDFCATEVGYEGCALPLQPCVRACRQIGQPATCTAWEEACGLDRTGSPSSTPVFWRSTSETCLYAPATKTCSVRGGVVTGRCNAQGTCVVVANATDAPPTTTDTPSQCSYQLSSRAPCNNACGGGVQIATFLCDCDDGSTTSSPCGGPPIVYQQLACQPVTCISRNADPTVTLVVALTPSQFRSSSFLAVMQQVLLVPLNITRVVRVDNPRVTVVQFAACGPAGCLSAASVEAALRVSAIRSDVISGLGYSYSVESASVLSPGNSDNTNLQLIIILIVSIVAAGALAALAIYCIITRRRSKKEALERDRRRAMRAAARANETPEQRQQRRERYEQREQQRHERHERRRTQRQTVGNQPSDTQLIGVSPNVPMARPTLRAGAQHLPHRTTGTPASQQPWQGEEYIDDTPFGDDMLAITVRDQPDWTSTPSPDMMTQQQQQQQPGNISSFSHAYESTV